MSKFSIATSERYTDNSGQQQEKTEWHNIVSWGKLAEVVGQHLAKGRQVYVEGKITTRSWDDQNSGQKRYMTEVVAGKVIFLGSRDDSQQGGQGQGRRQGGGQTGGGQGRQGGQGQQGDRGQQGGQGQGGQQGQGQQGGQGQGGQEQYGPEDDSIPF